MLWCVVLVFFTRFVLRGTVHFVLFIPLNVNFFVFWTPAFSWKGSHETDTVRWSVCQFVSRPFLEDFKGQKLRKPNILELFTLIFSTNTFSYLVLRQCCKKTLHNYLEGFIPPLLFIHPLFKNLLFL